MEDALEAVNVFKVFEDQLEGIPLHANVNRRVRDMECVLQYLSKTFLFVLEQVTKSHDQGVGTVLLKILFVL